MTRNMQHEWSPHSCYFCKNQEPFKNYQKYELIGQGGFAKVYRGKRLCDNYDIALKIIDKHQLKLKNAQSRVNEEVQIHYTLRNPLVVQLLEVFEDESEICLILELCACDMQNYLNSRQTFTEDETRHYMRQIIRGVQFLHQHNILHRDLKLHNLLLTKKNNVKIADFGLAKKLVTSAQTNYTMVGTPNFLAPEIATRKTHSFEADIWSLGVLTYQCLVGKPPFDDHDVLSTLKRVASVSYELPHELSFEAKDLICKILQKDTKKRLTLLQIINHPFFLVKEHSVHSITSLKKNMSTDSDISLSPSLLRPSSFQRPYYSNTSGISVSLNQHQSQSLATMNSSSHSSKLNTLLPPLHLTKTQSNLSHNSKKNIHNVLVKLNTQRLDSRHVTTKNNILDILSNGEVVIQHIVDSKGTKRVVDIFRVSANGEKIINYRPDKHHYSSCFENIEQLSLPDNYEEFTFDNLPEKLWHKYQRALKFVNIIRSLRSKIIMFTKDTKCRLMETTIEFDVLFYANDAKISIYRKNLDDINSPLEIKYVDGKVTSTLMYDDVVQSSVDQLNISTETKQMIDKAIKLRENCLMKNCILEEHHAQFPGGSTFPAIFGEKPK